MNGMSHITRKLLQGLRIIWTLLAHCKTGDTSVNVTALKGLNVTDQGLSIPLVLDNSQGTGISHALHPPNDQHSPDHKNVQLTLDSATSGHNASFNGKKVSTVPYADNNTTFISQYSKCDPKKEAMLISICPEVAEEEDKSMCQSDEVPPAVDTIFPVTDSVSGYHFRNFYCWRCFNQSGKPLTWSGELGFNSYIRPDNYSSLESFLHFIDSNPALFIWKPPSQFSFPKCEDVDLLNCTVCVPGETIIIGCSYVGRPQHRGPETDTHKCYACTSYEAHNSLSHTHLCENKHYEEVTNIKNWLNFYFVTWNRSNTLMIEQVPGKKFIDEVWTAQKCSVDSGTCSATACMENVLLVNGKCEGGTTWFLIRLVLCQFQEHGDNCFRQRPRDFLDKQFRNVGIKPINITALDIFYNDFCSYNTGDDLELNYIVYSDSATLKDIITTPIMKLMLFHNQTDHFIHLRVNITEKNDFDSLEIEMSGWTRPAVRNHKALFYTRVLSILVQIMAIAGVEGHYSFCESFLYDISASTEGSPNCKVRIFCPREIQEGFKDENKPLTSDAHRFNTPGIICSLRIALTSMMLHWTRWICP